MKLGYFSEHAYERLLADVALNAKHYESDEDNDWVSEYFTGIADYYALSNVLVRSVAPYQQHGDLSDKDKCDEDIINVRIVFDAMKTLTPLQATNKYMWTYLCHCDLSCYRYIQHRWLKDVRENTIKTRFFVRGSNSILNDNAISRLWWYGYLTYDSTSPNPYHLTEVLLTNQTICTDVIDTLNRMNPVRLQGLLLAIEQFVRESGTTRGVSDRVRECNRRLNRYAAVTMIDYLDRDEVKDLALGYLRQED